MSIGQRIKELRKILHLSAGDFAIKLQIPVRTIGSYERDEVPLGPKFLSALIKNFQVNINWLLSGKGTMFISKRTELELNYIAKLQAKFKMTEKELSGLLDVLDSEASRDMVLKFIEIKKGNKDALDSLICNLQGIQAIYN